MHLSFKIAPVLLFVFLSAADISEFIDDGYIVINSDNEAEYENYLQQYLDEPLYWKGTNYKELEELPLNEFLKNSIIYMFKNEKKIRNWQDFRERSGFSETEMAVVRLFITFEKIRPAKAKIYNYNSMTGEKEFQINKNFLNVRFTSPSGWYMSGVSERDQLERNVFDHVNFSIKSPQLHNHWQFWLGSFRFNWGSGLFFNTNPMNMMSNSGSANLYRARARFNNYTGSEENNYLFGPAVHYRSGHYSIFGFYSQNRMDCRIENGVVTSVPFTGRHVSETEISGRNQLVNQSIGAAFLTHFYQQDVGIMIFRNSFNHSILAYDSRDNLSGVSVSHKFSNLYLFANGEYALDADYSLALTQSLQYRRKIYSFGISGRYISPEFDSFSGSILRQFGGKLHNEKGFYYFFSAKINDRSKAAVFADFFSRIKPENKGDPVVRGTQMGLYYRVRMSGKNRLEFKINRKNDGHVPKNTFNCKVSTTVTKKIALTNRYAFVRINTPNIDGYGQGVSSYISIRNGFTRFTIGGTHYFSNHSDCRLYIYEPGIPLKFNLVSLSGSGRNYFLSVDKKVNAFTTLYLAAKQMSGQKKDKYYLRMQLLVAL